MYELIQVSDNCFYIESPAKIGLVKLNDTDVCLIDSGNDKDAGKKIKKILDANNFNLKLILNTHSHADHIGGNAYLQAQTGCKILAPGIECDFTNHPVLESGFIYGGFSPKSLRHKFIMAKESIAEALTEENCPSQIKILPLPGHSFDMVGFIAYDNVVYLADSLSSEDILNKYKINFQYDIEASLSTLEGIKELKADIFIPSHAKATDDIIPLADFNINVINEIALKIVDICKVPHSFEEILQTLFTEYNLTMTLEQHCLVGSTLRSYLSWLVNSGKLEYRFEENRMLFISKV